MAKQQHQARWWQRIIRRIASSRGGAWFFSHTLHHMDRPVIRLSNGRQSLTGILAGLPVVTLTTAGAKSGEPRTVPLVGIAHGDRVVLIASNFGRSHHPAWYHNLRANPEATLSVQGNSGTYMAREATGAEHEKYWHTAVDLYAGYAAYQQRTGGRQIPVMVLTPKNNCERCTP